jgi:glycosyltransferase involved in cell wall biosynthesis
MSISVLILTKNEKQDLPACLASVAWSDDVHVLDSLSTDGTQELARAAGARVTERPFDDYSKQRNFGLHDLPYRHPWLLILDADERIPQALAEEMKQAISTARPEVVGFRIRRRDFFLGRWLKHVQASPFYIRLVRPKQVEYTPRVVNEVLVPIGTGQIGDLTQPFDHYPFSKGLDHWFAKHNAYSRMEADQILSDRANGVRFSILKAFFERDFNRRRWHQKELFYRLPFRPTIKFLILYVLKRGFLDGVPGLLYAQMQACYERMIVTKTVETSWRVSTTAKVSPPRQAPPQA